MIILVIETAPIVDVERMTESSALMRPGEDGDGVEYAKELAAERVPFKVYGGRWWGVLRTVETEKPGSSSRHLQPPGPQPALPGSVAKAVVSQAPTSVVVIKPTPEEIAKVKTLLRRAIEPSPEKAVRSIIRTRQFKIGGTSSPSTSLPTARSSLPAPTPGPVPPGDAGDEHWNRYGDNHHPGDHRPGHRVQLVRGPLRGG